MALPDILKANLHNSLHLHHNPSPLRYNLCTTRPGPKNLQSCDWQASTFDESLAGLNRLSTSWGTCTSRDRWQGQNKNFPAEANDESKTKLSSPENYRELRDYLFGRGPQVPRTNDDGERVDYLPIFIPDLQGLGASRLVNRFGIRRVLVGSAGLIATGSALLVGISPNGDYFGILPGMILWSLGASIGFPAINVAAIAGTKPGEEGLASGLISISSRLGFPLGLAVLLTVAGATDPQPVADVVSAAGLVRGFQFAIATAALLGVLGVLNALRVKEPPKWQKYAPGPQ